MMLRLLKYLGICAAVLLAGGLATGGYMIWQAGRQLPDHGRLANYRPPVMTRIHAADGGLIAEYARERRLYVPVNVIPQRVIQAFLAAEDQNFYDHHGIDIRGVARAMVDNVFNLMNNRRLVGGSTITQQVAKNFLLGGAVTLDRKLKEWLLARRMEQAFTKDQILELYLNEIYLGLGSYGVAAAALNYFNKPLDRLGVAEAAYLAALPKGPNNYHPFRRPAAALARRNWVLRRMAQEGFITGAQASRASASGLHVRPRTAGVQLVEASYFAEDIRRQIHGLYGEDELYEGGLSVRTTLDPRLQIQARRALRAGLQAYDRRHGWRGPVRRVPRGVGWRGALQAFKPPGDIAPWRMAAVLKVSRDKAVIGLRPQVLASGGFSAAREVGVIALKDTVWARRPQEPDPETGKVTLGPRPGSMADVLAPGDVIYAEPTGAGNMFALRQMPAVNGAIVALDPFTGRVLAMEGGFSYQQSEFNRASQARRQPGSAFKPFVYAAALEDGFTPASIILDAPLIIDQGPGLGFWKPENYGKRFYGPSTLRTGLEKSRNLITVRLAHTIGMDRISRMAGRFGLARDLPPMLSMALGAGETTLLRLTGAYAVFVNGGRSVNPALIDRIQDRWGRTIYSHDQRTCEACKDTVWRRQPPPEPSRTSDEVVTPQTAYQVVSMLEGVVKRGTGRRVRGAAEPLAGKTGTTNNEHDAWFIGFSPNLVVGVFVGFDEPATLGDGETGGRVAGPIFRDFIKAALDGAPAALFRTPPGISLIRVNLETGTAARQAGKGVIWESFKTGTGPNPPGSTPVDDTYGQTAIIGDPGIIDSDAPPQPPDVFASGIY